MSTKVEKELESHGYAGDPERFKTAVGESHFTMFPNWTDEELLQNPRSLIELCDNVRRLMKCNLPDSLIARTLINLRKSGHSASYSPMRKDAYVSKRKKK